MDYRCDDAKKICRVGATSSDHVNQHIADDFRIPKMSVTVPEKPLVHSKTAKKSVQIGLLIQRF
jgi:hypothetical protein